jgi:hypothetical protein
MILSMKLTVFAVNVFARTRSLDCEIKITLRNLAVTKRAGWNMFMIISVCALTSTELEIQDMLLL